MSILPSGYGDLARAAERAARWPHMDIRHLEVQEMQEVPPCAFLGQIDVGHWPTGIATVTFVIYRHCSDPGAHSF